MSLTSSVNSNVELKAELRILKRKYNLLQCKYYQATHKKDNNFKADGINVEGFRKKGKIPDYQSTKRDRI
jgi:hypothetical protein